MLEGRPHGRARASSDASAGTCTAGPASAPCPSASQTQHLSPLGAFLQPGAHAPAPCAQGQPLSTCRNSQGVQRSSPPGAGCSSGRTWGASVHPGPQEAPPWPAPHTPAAQTGPRSCRSQNTSRSPGPAQGCSETVGAEVRTGPPGKPPANLHTAPRPPSQPGHLFRQEGGLAHGRVGTGSNVEDAVTHLRAEQWSGGWARQGGAPSEHNLTSKE